MSLGLALARIADYLGASLAAGFPGVHVGLAEPTGSSELPALVLSATDAVEVVAGVGNVPRPPQRSPRKVVSTIALADPVLRFDDETVVLLSVDRTVLQLPHNGLVHADGGAPPPPLGNDDLQIVVGAQAYTLVAGAPGPLEFFLDRAAAAAIGYGDPDHASVLRFGGPLPPGPATLTATYYVGEWEMSTIRFRGNLAVEAVGTTVAAVDQLSDAVGAALRRGYAPQVGTIYVATPTAWGPVTAPELGLGGARRRSLTFRFDIEVETAVIPTGGGVIARVDAAVNVDRPLSMVPPTESFSVTKQESP